MRLKARSGVFVIFFRLHRAGILPTGVFVAINQFDDRHLHRIARANASAQYGVSRITSA